ncbi:Response regulator receiver domain-containing protein [Halopelagius inordinatus]|uniref:Response regulator receiver domain-containing protein n=1 Tax=Halopelagius inordinatus TaxID=553467 RepID=A0A1I2SD21_9EURY|nr:response regulator [Halopelagius inordinatus]SFG47871.1 Response regulator receiver domain-containing protein [Halopelagius inordinatus]
MSSEDGRECDPIEILLVEPSPGDTRLFTESFEDAKIRNSIHAVSDGEEALDFVYRRGEHADSPRPDLVLLEPQLPGDDGMAVLSELNNEPLLADVPVVILTSSDLGEEIVKSHGLEADHYIRKPVAPDEFIRFAQSVERFWISIVRRSSTAD